MKTKLLWRVTAVLLSVAYPAIAASPASGPALMLADSTPDEIIERYDRIVAQTAEDYFTLALAHFGKLSIKESLEAANRALPMFDDPQKKALCFQLIAQCYGALGDYSLAAKAATEGQQIQPDSRDLAALRLAYYKELGDEVNFAIANEHLMRLDPVYRKDPKLEPATCAIIITGIICLTAVAVKTLDSMDKAQDPQVRESLAKAFENIAGLAFTLAMLATPLKGAK